MNIYQIKQGSAIVDAEVTVTENAPVQSSPTTVLKSIAQVRKHKAVHFTSGLATILLNLIQLILCRKLAGILQLFYRPPRGVKLLCRRHQSLFKLKSWVLSKTTPGRLPAGPRGTRLHLLRHHLHLHRRGRRLPSIHGWYSSSPAPLQICLLTIPKLPISMVLPPMPQSPRILFFARFSFPTPPA